MAVLQSTDELEVLIGNKYSLVIVAAKRARQLKEGHPALAQEASPNPLSIALREISEQRVSSIAPPEEELAPAPRDVITSLVTGADFDLGDDELDLEDSDAVDDLAALLVGTDDEEEEEESETEDILAPTAAATDDDEDDDTDDVEDVEVEAEDDTDDEETEE